MQRIQNAYHDLWERVHDSIQVERGIREEKQQLANRLTEVVGRAELVDLFENTKLMEICRQSAIKELRERYSKSNGKVRLEGKSM